MDETGGDVKTQYLFLDDERDRRELIDQISRVRQEVLDILNAIPEPEHYTPRYHGWSPAAMLAHLNTSDSYSLWSVKMALIGFRPSMSLRMLNRSNDLMARFYRKRMIGSSIKSMKKNSARIERLVRQLPVDRYSRLVFHPAQQQYITVERAIQDLFLHHWHGHLKTMREVEGLQSSEPSDGAER